MLVIQIAPAFGQTPWEAAPAKPAELPNKYRPAAQVQSLPPPPRRNSVSPQPNPQISTPAHVPLGPAPAGSAATPGPLAAKKPLPNQGGGNRGLVPDSLGLPIDTLELPRQPRNSGIDLPLPPPEVLQSLGQTDTPPADSSRPRSLVPGSLTGYESPAAESRLAETEAKAFDAGKLIAVVGTDHILAGDMAVFIEPIIEDNRDKLRSAMDEERLRSQLTRQALGQYIEIKAMHREFFRDMVGTAAPSEIEEMTKKVSTKASKIFFEQQVPTLLKKYDAPDLVSLEEKLREKSMSIHQLRSQFIEQVLSSELERKYVPADFEISRDELLKYYQEHREDWEVPAKARWRELTVRFDKHDGNRAEVDALIKQMGNEIFLGGKSFEAVAKQSSEGFTASEGGEYSWTTKGSLKSKELDEALFSLELGRLSRVITDDVGMHIIEVLERTDATTMEFTEAQTEIRQELSYEKRMTESEKFRRRVMARTPVWSLWPEDLKQRAPHARPLSDAIGDIEK